MATADIQLTSRRDWILANPWPWAFFGLASSSVAWSRNLLDLTEGPTIFFIVIGLLTVGVAVALSLCSSRSACVDSLGTQFRSFFHLALAVVFGVTCLALTLCLLGSLLGLEFMPWHIGQTVMAWVLFAPLTGVTAISCIKRAASRPYVTGREETSPILILAAIALTLCSRALYNSNDATAWDTIRLFFNVFAAASFIAAPLVLAPETTRRVTISLLVVFHFGGIFTATLSAPPAPWIVGQVWTRIYRPYLEFMYLNNAYHFYSPEPGPASYVWFRLFYEDTKGVQHATWHKIPKLDDKGFHGHSVALEYQRTLALTENTVHSDSASLFVVDAEGNSRIAGFYERRMHNSPLNKEIVILGQEKRTQVMNIPFYPFLQHLQQYRPPSLPSMRLIESFAKHACNLPPPDPSWTIKSVKVYRVQHNIPPAGPFMRGLDPQDPELYLPYYLGEYTPDGKLQNPDTDPFLFWLLPVLRDRRDPNGPITHYALKHAGDPKFMIVFRDKENRFENVIPPR